MLVASIRVDGGVVGVVVVGSNEVGMGWDGGGGRQ